MDQSLKDLESRLESLIPKGLSDSARLDCSLLIDELSLGKGSSARDANSQSTLGLSWQVAAAAASVALGIGLGGGWWLGRDAGLPATTETGMNSPEAAIVFDVLNRETWLSANDTPKVYVSDDGEVREVFSEVAVTTEILKDPQSGHVVTVETTDHNLVDSVKNEF